MTRLRQAAAAGLAVLMAVPAAPAQVKAGIEPVKPRASVFLRPYQAQTVPPARLGNSERLKALMRAGQLYLTVQDAIALALENNIDVEIARYSPVLARVRLTRAEAGGALPGVPSAAAQAGTVASGQGVLGTQSAAGVAGGGTERVSRGAGNAQITQLGPVTQNLDPTIQSATTYAHRSIPQPNAVQSLTPVLVQDLVNTTYSIQQGLLSGGNFTLSLRGNWLEENSPSNLLNPSWATTLSLSVQHNLLQGFGRAVNARTITVSRINLRTSDEQFRNQVMNAVDAVLNACYSLLASGEELKARRSALETAERFVRESRRRYELGALAGVDVLPAESQEAAARRDLIIAETTHGQNELRLKNLISRNGVADPELRAARIVLLDSLSAPGREPLPELPALVEKALQRRPDVLVRKAAVESAEVNSVGTRSAILPRLIAFGTTTQQGLAGTGRTVTQATPGQPPRVQQPDPYFTGGFGTALGQSFRRNFPAINGGAFFQTPLRNRQGTADQAVDELQLRQSQLQLAQFLLQVQVDLANALAAAEQARTRWEAAAKGLELARALLAAEEKKFSTGFSTPFEVVQQQRQLAQAQAAEAAARASWHSARLALERASGTTLETYGVSLDEARRGEAARAPGGLTAGPDNK
ncbi:MAG: TolC family protein [Acidobacteriota bacterium]